MKRAIFSLMALASLCMAQAQYTISLDLGDVPDAKAYLEHMGQNVDSVDVISGKGTLNGPKLYGADYVSISSPAGKWTLFSWVTNGDNVAITRDKSDNIIITGSKTQDEYKAYTDHMNRIRNYQRQIVADGKAALDAGDRETYNAKVALLETTRAEEDSLERVFILSNPSSFVSLNEVYNMRLLHKKPLSEYLPLFETLDKDALAGRQWDTLSEVIVKDKSLEPGVIFNDFTMEDVYGDEFKLSDYRGKYVLLTIGMPHENIYDSDIELRKELYAKYAPQGLEMIDFIKCDDPSEILSAAGPGALTWVFGSDFKGWGSSFLAEHGIDQLSLNVLLDPEGRIIANRLFGDELRKELESTFAK